MKAAARVLTATILNLGACALVVGCAGNPSYFPYLLPPGPAIPTHSKPAGEGYYADYDPHACRIVLRPEACTARVRGTQVLIATVYDGQGVPRRKRRVEWMIDGPGSIIEVDESGYLPGRGMKLDNKFAYSHTDYQEHCINRGGVDFTIGPGQTWCVVTSPVEGETTVTAYVPAISDWNNNRAYARLVWTDAGLEFPPPLAARAGGEATLGTKVAKKGQDFRVRYRIIDGPPAALTSREGGPVDSVREATAAVGEDGLARVAISQPAPAGGVNRIAIEVVKPDPDVPGEYKVVFNGETKVTWQAPQLAVAVNAPKNLALNQDVTITYTVTDNGPIPAGNVTMTARLPEGMNLVSTEPKAAVDDNELIWTLPAGARGKAQTVRATYRPARVGDGTLTAEARAEDGTTGRAVASVAVTEAKLLVKIEGPSSGIVGESLPFQVTVTNTGDGPANQVRVQARLDGGLEAASKSLDQTIASLAAGQSKTITIPVSVKKGGKHSIEAGAATGELLAVPQMATIDVQDAQLGLTAHGPPKSYVGEEVTWQLVIRNTGDVPMGQVVVRATLPPEVRLLKATDGGKLNGRQLVWDLGTAPARQERTIAMTIVCDKPTGKATMTATVLGTPTVEREGAARTVSGVKPVGLDKPVETTLEIIGVPALQISLKDAKDPIVVGERTTYTIRVKNAGTLAATNVQVSAELPAFLRGVRATGPASAGKIEKQTATFPAIPALAPNAEATFVIEVEGLVPGDARVSAEARSAATAQPLRAEEPTRVLER